MAPARSSNRRTQHDQSNSARPAGLDEHHGVDEELFLEPMMGTPLAIYVEKDVEDRDAIVDLITVSCIYKPCFETLDVSFESRAHYIFWLDRREHDDASTNQV